MTETRPSTDLLGAYLEQLVEAGDNWDRVRIFNAAADQGLAGRYVTCDLCPWPTGPRVMTLPGSVRHLRESERVYREEHRDDPTARLHQVGDLRAATETERRGDHVPPPWGAEPCGRKGCSGQVVWARTESGARIAIDFRPDPAGTVVLVADPTRFLRPPLARFLHTEFEQQQVAARDRHTRHVSTCTALEATT